MPTVFRKPVLRKLRPVTSKNYLGKLISGYVREYDKSKYRRPDGTVDVARGFDYVPVFTPNGTGADPAFSLGCFGFLNHAVSLDPRSMGAIGGDKEATERLQSYWLTTTADQHRKAYHLLFSLPSEYAAAARARSYPVDGLLVDAVNHSLDAYAKAFHPGDELSYLVGVHHDTENPHAHVLLYPRTSSGKQLRMSDHLAVRSGDTRTFFECQTGLQTAFSEVVEWFGGCLGKEGSDPHPHLTTIGNLQQEHMVVAAADRARKAPGEPAKALERFIVERENVDNEVHAGLPLGSLFEQNRKNLANDEVFQGTSKEAVAFLRNLASVSAVAVAKKASEFKEMLCRLADEELAPSERPVQSIPFIPGGSLKTDAPMSASTGLAPLYRDLLSPEDRTSELLNFRLNSPHREELRKIEAADLSITSLSGLRKSALGGVRRLYDFTTFGALTYHTAVARETNQPHHLLTPMRGMTSDVRLFLTRQESDEAVERMLADAQKWDENLVHRIRRSSAEESSGSEHQREDNATPVFARDIPPDSEEVEAEEFTHSYGQPLSFRSREIAALSLARLEQLEKAQRRFGDADLERRAETFTRDQLL
jgi:hypothetical protein